MDQNVSYYGIKGFFMANSTMGQLSKFWIPHRAFYDRRAAFLRRGTSEHYRFSKRLRRILLILLIIFIVATVVAGIIIGTQNHSKQAENSSQVMNLALNGDIVGDIVQDIVEAILRILWLVLVYSVANLSIGMEEIFK
jgi:type III secretory pathway component EscS